MPIGRPFPALPTLVLLIALGGLFWQWWHMRRGRGTPHIIPRGPFWVSAGAWVWIGLWLARPPRGFAGIPAWLLPGLGLLAAALVRLLRAEVPRVLAEEARRYAPDDAADAPPARLDPEDRRLVRRLLSLRRRRAAELMLPLARVTALREGARVADAIARLREQAHWRLPLLDRAGGRVIGALDCRDLVDEALAPAAGADEPATASEDVRRRCQAVTELPAAAPAIELVAALRTDRHGLVAIVDRHGRVIGFAAWDHVFQTLVGGRAEEVGL
jgi:CBS domain containing-hemolysin-like protein